MKSPQFNLKGKFDVERFCASEGVWSGELAESDLTRVAENGFVDTPFVASIRGELSQFDKAHLIMHVAGGVALECQRCLKEYVEEIDATASIWVAKSEREATEIEASVDEESDVILASEVENALQLLEDEILLAIPFSPQCGDPVCAADA